MLTRILLLLPLVMLAACASGPTTAKPPTVESLIAAWKAAGLEADSPRKMEPADYGAAPMLCDGTRFLLPSLGADKGGRVFICPNDADRDRLAAYYRDLAKSSAAFFSHVYVKGPVVVQLNGDLKDDVAKRYEQALP